MSLKTLHSLLLSRAVQTDVVVSEICTAIERAKNDHVEAEKLLTIVVLAFSSEDGKTMLDAIALDVAPSLLQLCSVSPQCTQLSARLADQIVQACSPRETLTMLLEVLGLMSLTEHGSENKDTELVHGSESRCASTLSLQLHIIKLLPIVLRSIPRKRVTCTTDCLPQIARVSKAVGDGLHVALTGHANAASRKSHSLRCGTTLMTDGAVMMPGSAAEFASMAAATAASVCGEAIFWEDLGFKSPVDGEDELAEVLFTQSTVFVDFVYSVHEEILLHKVSSCNQESLVTLQRQLALLSLHLLGVLYLPCDKALLLSTPSLQHDLAKLLRVLRALMTGCSSKVLDWASIWTLCNDSSHSHPQSLADTVSASDEVGSHQDPQVLVMDSAGGAALLVLLSLEQRSMETLRYQQSHLISLPCDCWCDWLLPPKTRLDIMKFGFLMSSALFGAAEVLQSQYIILSAFRLMMFASNLAAKKQTALSHVIDSVQVHNNNNRIIQTPMEEAGDLVHVQSTDQRSARGGGGETRMWSLNQEENEVHNAGRTVLQVIALNVAQSTDERTRNEAFSCMQAVLRGLPPLLRLHAIMSLSSMPFPPIVALAMQQLQHQVLSAMERPGSSQAAVFMQAHVLMPVQYVLQQYIDTRGKESAGVCLSIGSNNGLPAEMAFHRFSAAMSCITELLEGLVNDAANL
ncbi:hypothetical protein CEUSTIGMA_g8198.t1 [Chlamydomonas eustigma]|uniref:Uncharacterized protein n=1 Tax=Chlamydomonas eustigma TaxID=1157962 RepID=A0A250XCE6_9CHLO|nr:hypothetical protein CEUSTIGMA_g8198.t1 [Chlamydomonas eustigma]|eukprot:GAX80763.1 hypothetical protein CEUSTIGMA_g8198.t1 [Chlamydomonas eustigma]